MSTFPTFFLPGAGKSGTSSLHDVLNQHPDVAMCEPKEPHAFTLYAGREAERCRDLWAHKPGRRVRGESSTSTLIDREAPARIARLVPDARFVVLLREPVARTWSHWTWLRSQGLEWRPFRRALEADRRRPFDVRRSRRGNYRAYLESSRYGELLSRYVSTFGADRLLVLTSERFRREPLAVANDVFAFLGVDPLPHIDEVHANATREERWSVPASAVLCAGLRLGRAGWPVQVAGAQLRKVTHAAKDTMSDEDRRWLLAELRPDRTRLEALLDRRFPEWDPRPREGRSSA